MRLLAPPDELVSSTASRSVTAWTGTAHPRSSQGSSVPTGRDVDKVWMSVTEDGAVLLAGQELFLGGPRELLGRIAELVPADRVHAVITPNVDQTLTMQEDPALRRAYDEASLRITDGTPLVVLGRLLGADGLIRLTGADLLVYAARRAPKEGWRIALTGGAPEVADHAAEHLREQYGADVVAVPFPRIGSVDDPASSSSMSWPSTMFPQARWSPTRARRGAASVSTT